METVYADPSLKQIKKVGHDLDENVGRGLSDIISDCERLYCTQHIQQADVRQLKKRNANAKSIQRIMSDIYGSRTGPVEQLGLADAEDPQDYEIKLKSLREVWEGLIPGFHAWFDSHRSDKFRDNLVLSARND